MNRLGVRAGGGARRWSSAWRTATSVAALRLMMHFARADEDDGVAGAARGVRRGVPGLPYPRSLANSAGVVRYAEVGGDIVRPGIMLYGATPFAVRHRRDARPAAGDDAALARSSPCRSSRPATASATARTYIAPRGRTGSASSPAATPTAIRATRRTARRCSSAAGRCRMAGPRVDGHAHRRPDRRAGGARRQPGRAVGRRPAGRRRRRAPRRPSATNCCARSRRACRSSSPSVGADRPRALKPATHLGRHHRVHRRHRRRRLHRLQSRQGAQRARRDATSSPSTISRAPTSSATSSTARSPTTSTRTNSSRASPTAISTTTSRRSCTRARAPTRWRPTAAT